MDEPGLVVIGSGPAGVAAAEAFRKYEGGAAVTILTADPHPPYARPPLSKEYLRGQTDDVALHAPDWFADREIDVLTSRAVERIQVADHRVIGGGQHYPYRALVLACGAGPDPLPVPGAHRVLQLRSLADAAALRAAADRAESAVVIGAGFIGCEAAASLALQGVAVTLIAPDTLPQIARLGEEAGRRLVVSLNAAGVHYSGGVKVTELSEDAVHLDNGDTVGADLVLAAIGVTPRTDLAVAAGLTLRDGRIAVGADMATSAPDIYAAGDAASAWNGTAERVVTVEHWQDATDQGALAGAAAAGHPGQWDQVPGFWTSIGDTTLKYHAWGDGYDRSHLVEFSDGFTIWYESDGAVVGVLTCNADDDYELGEALIRRRAPVPRGAGDDIAHQAVSERN